MASVLLSEIAAIIKEFPSAWEFVGEKDPDPEVAIGMAWIIPGWLGAEHFYKRFRHHLRVLGFRTEYLDNGYSPSKHWWRSNEAFDEQVDRLIGKTGLPDIVCGHSTGGIQGMRLLPVIPDFELIAIKPAIRLGITPWKLRQYRRFGLVPLPLETPHLEQTLKEAVPHQKRMVTIAAKSDWLCPACAHEIFPYARNYVVDDHELGGCSVPHASFSDIPQVHSIIRQELKLLAS